MNNKSCELKTDLGIISGRDAIYIDNFRQEFDKIIICGELNSNLCEHGSKDVKWYKFEVTFIGVKLYEYVNIDLFDWKKWRTKSNFDEIANSSWTIKSNLSGFRHFILETYDYVYCIIGKNYEFKIFGER